MRLDGKTVLITGASGGIGCLLAEQLAATGANLLLAGRNEEALAATATRLRATGTAHVSVITADLCDAAGRNTLTQHCLTLPQGLFGLINNAGSNHFAWLENQSEQELQQQITLNLLAPILLTRALLPALQRAPTARILNVGSTFGSIGHPGYSAYCASKFGLRGFTEALRRELADTHVQVMYVAPRATATSLNANNVVALNRELGNAMDPPTQVALEIAKVFLAGEPAQCFLGFPEKLFARINQVFPAIVDAALRKQLPVIRRFARQSH